MRRTMMGFTLLGSLLMSGCDKDALEFAVKTSALLKQYTARLNKEISESEEYYRQYATAEVDSARRRSFEDDSVSRREMADKWSVDYIEQQTDAARVRQQLLEMASAQFDVYQSRWLSDLDESRIYLEKVEKLQADKEKVEALGKLLDTLSQKRSLLDRGKEIGKFVQTTKDELDKKICDGIQQEINKIGSEAGQADRKAALEQLGKDRKCKTNDAAGGGQ